MDKSSPLETVIPLNGIGCVLQQPEKDQHCHDEQIQIETPDEIEMMSQQSSDSRMEATSQESAVSHMEFSSQESDTSRMDYLNLNEENSAPDVGKFRSPSRPGFFLTITQKRNKENSVPRTRKRKSDYTEQCLREQKDRALILQKEALEKREMAVLAREQAAAMQEAIISENGHLFEMFEKKHPKRSKL